ncbi:oligosaccharide flippase family protein [Bacillus cereus group sp. Bce040]|uniref:oligosaccharide flippase family protein n=1 Tax=Bacillus cereus group sp. Bce040 TaxID=3445229 RepID=UPI003F276A14
MIIKKDIKRIAVNTIFLSMLQMFNYVMPFFLFPYLMYILGTKNFGAWMLVLSITQYLNILIDYGFNLSATRKVTLFKNDKVKINQLFTNVMFVKLLFFAFAFGLVLICNNEMNNLLHIPNGLMVEMFLYLFGLILTPFWLFQGLEQLKVPTVLNLIARMVSVIATFFFVRQGSDIFLLPIINGIPLILTGIISWLLLYRQGVLLVFPKWSLMKSEIKEGADLFISSISVTLYTTLNTVLLGIFAGPQSVAYYSICEKIIQAIKSVVTPLYQATYPYMVKALNDVKGISMKKLKILLLLSLSMGILIILGLNIFNEVILNYFFNRGFNTSVKYTLLIMSCIPLISFINNVLFIQTLVPLGESKYLRKVTILAGVVNISFVCIFSQYLEDIGSALGYMLSELTVLIFGGVKIYLMLKKKKEKGELIGGT